LPSSPQHTTSPQSKRVPTSSAGKQQCHPANGAIARLVFGVLFCDTSLLRLPHPGPLTKMTKRNAWSRAETAELLDIIRTSCVSFLDGTINNRKGQMYRQIEYEMQRRGGTGANRDARQIEHKWKNLKFGYERYKSELEQHAANDSKSWLSTLKPCEFYTELEELFSVVEQRTATAVVSGSPEVETIVGIEGVTYYDEEFVTEEGQELAVDDDTVVIEEIVYDSQDAIEFEEPVAGPSTSKASSAPLQPAQPPAPKRKKLTAENMDGLLLRICEMQKQHNDTFNRNQMEYIENEFETFREREREHLLQLKLDLEVLKQKFLARIQKIAIGEGGANEAVEETVVGHEAKRRRVGTGAGRRK
uniref:Myb/SANT-like DNA-binding domain-containing protein n=1 Tax=Anopheles coluzzii TaxID=1518534 RepID=A0A8W7PEQ6_ANOCL